MALSADLNGDGKIDFEEFMKHYPSTINMIHYHKTLSNELINVLEREKRLASVNLDDVG